MQDKDNYHICSLIGTPSKLMSFCLKSIPVEFDMDLVLVLVHIVYANVAYLKVNSPMVDIYVS